MQFGGDGLEVMQTLGDEDGFVFLGVESAERRVAGRVAGEEVG